MRADEKSVVSRFWEEVFSRGDVEAIDEIFAPGYVLHFTTVYPNGEARDLVRTGDFDLGGFVTRIREGFSDLQVSIEDQMSAEGGKVVTRFTVSGTHEDSGSLVSVNGISISLVSEGRIEESWVEWDALDLMQQLGLQTGGTEELRWPPRWWP